MVALSALGKFFGNRVEESYVGWVRQSENVRGCQTFSARYASITSEQTAVVPHAVSL